MNYQERIVITLWKNHPVAQKLHDAIKNDMHVAMQVDGEVLHARVVGIQTTWMAITDRPAHGPGVICEFEMYPVIIP
jgi:hypothetical protein